VDPTGVRTLGNLDVAASAAPEATGEDWTRDARYLEYTSAADPIGSGHTPRVPLRRFGASLYSEGPTRVVPLDLSTELDVPGPATSPGLLASFVRINAGESLPTRPSATSELYYVMRGRGASEIDGRTVEWEEGDFLTLPAGCASTHAALQDSTLYWVHDEPLLRYLGVAPAERRFRPTKFPRERVARELELIAAQPAASSRNRVSVILANAAQHRTLTATHVLWAMFGLLPAGKAQLPHRHQSVALDLILDCEPGCYTLVGPRLGPDGAIEDATRIDWEPGGAFVTPPGAWHAHFNESGAPAHLIPVQDAGLHTYLRSLDIRFSTRRP